MVRIYSFYPSQVFDVSWLSGFPLTCLDTFSRYSVFKVRLQILLPESANGLKWTRTTDLTLIRRAL